MCVALVRHTSVKHLGTYRSLCLREEKLAWGTLGRLSRGNLSPQERAPVGEGLIVRSSSLIGSGFVNKEGWEAIAGQRVQMGPRRKRQAEAGRREAFSAMLWRKRDTATM